MTGDAVPRAFLDAPSAERLCQALAHQSADIRKAVVLSLASLSAAPAPLAFATFDAMMRQVLSESQQRLVNIYIKRMQK